MFNSSGFPAAELQFDKNAKVIGSADAIMNLASDDNVSDLIIMAHGWNNDIADATALFSKLAAALLTVIDDGAVPTLAARGVALAGVYWPSKKFTDSDLIPGGAAAAASSVDEAAVEAAIDELRGLFPASEHQEKLDEARALVPLLEDKATARAKFADTLRSLLEQSAAEDEDGTTDLFAVSGKVLMDRLAVPAVISRPQSQQGGALGVGFDADAPRGPGGAAGLGSTLGGILGAAKNLLNSITYYEMKARAGTVGADGLAPVVSQIHSKRKELRIHLVGHSFGGRLVSATAGQLPRGSLASMTLLQAAFSHYGFAAEWSPGKAGGFRNAISNEVVSGPIVITHTANDKAVGIAYAIASRIAGQNAAGVGDANDTYGGIGRNGAQKTADAKSGRLLDVGGDYSWTAGSLHNLLADEFISDHSDIKSTQVAYAILSAVAST